MPEDFESYVRSTTPFQDQKPGTSGLRKKTKIFMQENYTPNFIQSILNAIPTSNLEGSTLVVGGDGRFFSNESTQIIIRLCAANGVRRVWVGQNSIMSTPAMSCVIRDRENGLAQGGFILTASHNPGGIDNDFGIKFNGANGAASVTEFTDKVYAISQTLESYKYCDLPETETSEVGRKYEYSVNSKPFTVEIISPTANYFALLQKVFSFEALRELFQRDDFVMHFDGLNGVSGAYARGLFHTLLGAKLEWLNNITPRPDFGGCHPDPNLTYAEGLVHAMGLNSIGEPITVEKPIPDFGCATDGDADRAMVLGNQFFVSPSDSLAVVVANAKRIPFFKNGLKGVARSMPTSAAVDCVATKQGIPLFEVPTGWKFFGNLMDSESMGKENYNPFICGEESFGLGANYIREKDGLFAILAWLSIIADVNKEAAKPLVSVSEIVSNHWRTYGRNYYTRYDYENVTNEQANDVMQLLKTKMETFQQNQPLEINNMVVTRFDDFNYLDSVDGTKTTNQGIRIYFGEGTRIIFRLSGTGSFGATIRVYMEKYEDDSAKLFLPTKDVMQCIVVAALLVSNIVALTGRGSPSVIT